MIDDDDDDDDIEIQDAPVPKPNPVKKSTAKKASSESRKAAAEAKKVKKEPATKGKKEPAASKGSGGSAEEILASIPDAELPEVDTSKKFNYHEFKAKQAEAGTASEGVDIPVAQENCLAGMAFVFTGTLPNLGRDQGQDIVKRLGGKVMSAPSKNTTCVVLGAEAGPKKIQVIKEKNIKAIDEDGFLELLRRMPADGGGGEAAKKALEKQAKEQEKIEKQAEEMSREFAQKEKEAEKKSASKKDKSSQSSQQEEVPRDLSKEQLWTTKYAPTSLNHICGNKGAVEKLDRWLTNWHKNAKGGFKSPGPDGSGIFRAAILHGPPGIGKTTAAHLVAEAHGYDVIESNASDTRSKSLLANGVGRRLNTTSLAGFFNVNGEDAVKSQKNVCLIMDEVDGMSGGDRGGVGQMAAICRTTKIPLILICNEKSLPKMRPFDRVTFDVPFRRPDANAIRARIMSICHREGLKVSAAVVDQLCQSTRSDIRQIINMLSTYARTEKTMDFDQSKGMSKQWEKHSVLRPFDIIGRLMSPNTFAANNNISLNDKIEIYFHDHDFTPLMVQENYMNTMPRGASSDINHLSLVADAAESISDGDLVDRSIHSSQQNWSLMPLHAVLSSVRPAYFVAGQGRGRYNFTSYLGNLSKGNKYNRLLQEIQSHARLRVSGDKSEVRLQYLSLLAYKLLQPLLDKGSDGIDEVVETMDQYYLTKEDWDVIMELSVGPNKGEELAKKLPTQVKSGFTRKYNSTDHPVPFMKSASQLAPKKSSTNEPAPDIDDIIGQDSAEPEPAEDEKEEDPDDISKDKYIKVGKPKKSKASTTKANGKGKAKTKK